MAEINDGKGIKTIAYYLPQFHAIPENDAAWGKGFTEWTNVRKASPMFDNHYQPKEPLNDNYYNLLDDQVKIWQSHLAQEYGLFGFCYYHYWFKNGKKLLEKPAEQMLANKEISIPFCFSWANENWSKRWDGGDSELIAEQDYGTESDWKKHIEYLVPFFKDSRYITFNGNPIFLIYKPEEIPNVDKMIDYMQHEIRKYGFNSICFMIQNPNWYFQPSYNLGKFDYQIKFYPFFSLAYRTKNMKRVIFIRRVYRFMKKIHLENLLEQIFISIRKKHKEHSNSNQIRLNYDDIWQIAINSQSSPELVEGAFVDWDNTARKKNGYVHYGATPEKFEKYMRSTYRKIEDNNLAPIVFINAWNEWCEGAYLEPDKKHKYAYLEALKSSQLDV